MAKWDRVTIATWLFLLVEAHLPKTSSAAAPLITAEIMDTAGQSQILTLLESTDALHRVVDDICGQYDGTPAPLDVGHP